MPTQTFYPITYKSSLANPPRNSKLGLSQTPIIWLFPNQIQKLNEKEYNAIKDLPQYLKLREQGAIIEKLPVTVKIEIPREQNNSEEITEENVLEDLTGFSASVAKEQIGQQKDVTILNKWLTVEKSKANPRVTVINTLELKIKSLGGNDE